MKVRFLFYRAKFEWRSFLKTRKIHLVDDAISWWTWIANIGTRPYSHVEVWLPDEQGLFKRSDGSIYDGQSRKIKYKIVGTCYTSTMRGDEKGTCSRLASEVLSKHPERWEYKEFEITPTRYEVGSTWAKVQVKNNKGYGFKNFGKFFGLGKVVYDRFRDICSQFSYNYAVMVFIFPLPFKIVSPRRLSRLLPGKMQRLVDA